MRALTKACMRLTMCPPLKRYWKRINHDPSGNVHVARQSWTTKRNKPKFKMAIKKSSKNCTLCVVPFVTGAPKPWDRLDYKESRILIFDITGTVQNPKQKTSAWKTHLPPAPGPSARTHTRRALPRWSSTSRRSRQMRRFWHGPRWTSGSVHAWRERWQDCRLCWAWTWAWKTANRPRSTSWPIRRRCAWRTYRRLTSSLTLTRALIMHLLLHWRQGSALWGLLGTSIETILSMCLIRTCPSSRDKLPIPDLSNVSTSPSSSLGTHRSFTRVALQWASNAQSVAKNASTIYSSPNSRRARSNSKFICVPRPLCPTCALWHCPIGR